MNDRQNRLDSLTNNSVISSAKWLFAGTLLIAMALAGCGSDTAEVREAVTTTCDKYDTLDGACNYDKFTDRQHCEDSADICDDDVLTKLQAFYDCLGQCTDGNMSIEDLSTSCSAEAFGDEVPDCLM